MYRAGRVERREGVDGVRNLAGPVSCAQRYTRAKRTRGRHTSASNPTHEHEHEHETHEAAPGNGKRAHAPTNNKGRRRRRRRRRKRKKKKKGRRRLAGKKQKHGAHRPGRAHNPHCCLYQATANAMVDPPFFYGRRVLLSFVRGTNVAFAASTSTPSPSRNTKHETRTATTSSTPTSSTTCMRREKSSSAYGLGVCLGCGLLLGSDLACSAWVEHAVIRAIGGPAQVPGKLQNELMKT